MNKGHSPFGLPESAMPARTTRFLTLTRGERSLALALAVIGLFGGLVAFILVVRVDPAAFFGRGPSWYEAWVIGSGGVGTALALFVVRHRVARRGAVSAILTLLGVSLLAGLIGGSLALPLYGTMFGPFLFVVTLAGSPVLALLWCVNLVAVHMLLCAWQDERDSIFAPARAS